jgi:predicted RNase H-like HicB family nuclease
MKSVKITYWQDGKYYIGYINDFPDYCAQGMSKEELLNNLKELYDDIASKEIPYIRRVEDLVITK